MRNVLAMVLAAGRVDELSVLTMHRPKSALPFGGLYRVIDFPLSNLMHSGISHVGILSQYRPFSLMNHIGDGSSWDMNGRHSYLHILPPYKGHKPQDWYRGTADAIHQNIDYIKRENPEMTLILSGDHVYQMDYRRLHEFHKKNNADVTIAFKQMPIEQCSRFGLAHFDENEISMEGGRLVRYTEKPKKPLSNWASLTIYLFKTNVLVNSIEKFVGRGGKTDFGRDVFPELVKTHRVFGYRFSDFWGYTRTIAEYYQSNMSLLGDHPAIDPEQWRIRTNLSHRHIQDHLPTLFGSSGNVKNSLVYNGCRIYGHVENCILFPGVTVGKGAVIKDSIIFYDTKIGAGATVQAAIIDTDTHVCEGAVVGSKIEGDSAQILQQKLTLLGRDVIVKPNACILPGTHLSAESNIDNYRVPQSIKEVV